MNDRSFRLRVGDLLARKDVEVIILSFIVINSIMMGIGTFDFVSENPKVLYSFNTIDFVFLIIFTIELVAHFTHLGLQLFRNGWLVFDFLVILLSWTVSGSQVFRAFRIFRTLRVIKRVTALKNLLDAIFASLPKVVIVGALLCVLLSIFSIMFTDLYKDLDGKTMYNYFGSLDRTILTLFQFMTFDTWPIVTRDVMQYEKWSWFPLLTFVIVSGFVAVNLIVGIIVETIGIINKNSKTSISSDTFVDNPSDNEDNMMSTNDLNERLDSSILQLEKQISSLMEAQSEIKKGLEELKTGSPS